MKMHHLRDLLAIVERGSIRAAARHLGIAQPALSRSIRKLEKEIGVPLFERRAKGSFVAQMGPSSHTAPIQRSPNCAGRTKKFSSFRARCTAP